ncbi:MAG: 30S ribosomal protein S3 [Candidatus Babeliales bacterium]
MGQKVHPIGFRLGVYKKWLSRWFARDSYGEDLIEDFEIRKLIDTALAKADISRIEIEKAAENIRIIIYVDRPGVVIGKGGKEIEALREKCKRLLPKRKVVDVSVQIVKNVDLDAALVAANVAGQLVRRVGYKKAMRKASEAVKRAGALGFKICFKGRLDGAEIARAETLSFGRMPLHTLKADIDYAIKEALTTYGKIGIKVWIYRGEFANVRKV